MTFEEKTISSQTIYEGAILKLRRDEVVVKDGSCAYREIVEHNGGSVAVAITDDKKVILVKQFRKAMDEDVIELPAGKIEDGEDPLETIVRELKEETGYTSSNIKLMAKFHPSVGYADETLYLYLATELTPGEPSFDEHEEIEIIEVDFDKAIEMIIEGQISDGKTMAGLLLAKEHLGQ